MDGNKYEYGDHITVAKDPESNQVGGFATEEKNC